MLNPFSFGAMNHIRASRLPAMQVPLRALVKSVLSPPYCRVHQVANSNKVLVLASGANKACLKHLCYHSIAITEVVKPSWDAVLCLCIYTNHQDVTEWLVVSSSGKQGGWDM